MRQDKLRNIKNSKSELNHAAAVSFPKARACMLSLDLDVSCLTTGSILY